MVFIIEAQLFEAKTGVKYFLLLEDRFDCDMVSRASANVRR
jgi:hypothetical protein